MKSPVIPLRVENVRQNLSSDRQLLTLKSGAASLECNREQAIVWALCNGRADMTLLARLVKRIEGLQLPGDCEDFVADTIERFCDAGFMRVVAGEQLDYPLDIAPWSHFVTTRGGLYGVNTETYQRLAFGMLFGLAVDDSGRLLYFDFPHLDSSLWLTPFSEAKKQPSDEGVVMAMQTRGHGIDEPQIHIRGIGNNCHSLLWESGTLFVVDTEAQSIWEIEPGKRQQRFPVFDAENYHHINSISSAGDYRLVMKCHRSRTDNRSAVGVFDSSWNPVRDIELPGRHCHDLLVESSPTSQGDLEFWYCDSANGRIRHYPTNRHVDIPSPVQANSTTRGLSALDNYFVVGGGRYGQYSSYADEPELLGAVSFVDRQSGTIDAQVRIPEAPCCIIANPVAASANQAMLLGDRGGLL